MRVMNAICTCISPRASTTAARHSPPPRGSPFGRSLRTVRFRCPAESSFRVVFHNHTLMSPEAIAWLNQFAALPLNGRQRVALVYLRQHGELSNLEYRRLTRVDALTAGQELKGLVQQGLLAQHGVGRWTTYSLAVTPDQQRSVPERPPGHEARILAYVEEHGSIGNQECRSLLDVDEKRAWYLLNKLKQAGVLAPIGKGRWRRYARS
jgi:predicted HTH transcriptional regulator